MSEIKMAEGSVSEIELAEENMFEMEMARGKMYVKKMPEDETSETKKAKKKMSWKEIAKKKMSRKKIAKKKLSWKKIPKRSKMSWKKIAWRPEFKKDLPSFSHIVHAAESKVYENRDVKWWFDELKEVMYDRDDLQDEIDTKRLRRRLENKPLNIKTWLRELISTTLIERRWKEIVARIEYLQILNKILGLPFLPFDKYSTTTYATTGHTQVMGRNLIPVVKDSFEDGFQEVYDDFDVFRFTKTLLEVFTGQTSDIQDIYDLQVKLKESLYMKKCLLVLDDVCCEDSSVLAMMCEPLLAGAKGSKIIVTTQSASVANKMAASCALDYLEHKDRSKVGWKKT
ncbi:hypothetical protein Q3G72_015456 [Acer saccharum]|nr:hypothetical protein Q3G72_015456 [Acer saccharum]